MVNVKLVGYNNFMEKLYFMNPPFYSGERMLLMVLVAERCPYREPNLAQVPGCPLNLEAWSKNSARKAQLPIPEASFFESKPTSKFLCRISRL